MKNKAVEYLKYSQISLFSSLAVCFLLVPKVIYDNRGVSYFGNHHLTIVPYAIGLILTSYFMFKASVALPTKNKRVVLLSKVLKVMAVLLIGVLLTPYKISDTMYHIHVGVGSLLFSIQFFLIIWLVVNTPTSKSNRFLLGTLLLGNVISMISLLPTVQIMLLGQIITQLSFGLLLIRTTQQLTRID